MKLSRVQVQHYRSIVDSGSVAIEPAVTVIIGKNEQGKTNFLRGVHAFNADQAFTPSDLPNHLRPSLEERPPRDIPVVTLWFALEQPDLDKLGRTLEGAKAGVELKCTKYYNNSYSFCVVADGQEQPVKFVAPDLSRATTQIRAAAQDLQVKLRGHAQRLPQFAANADKIDQITSALRDATFSDAAEIDNVVRTFTTSVKALTGQDQPILDDIAVTSSELEKAREAIRAEIQADPSRPLKQSLPRFILHSTKADHIPNQVNVADFIKDPDATSRGMANLCRAAGLSVQKVRELAATSDTTEREAYEDHYKATISGGLNEFWQQAEYDVHFRIEKEMLSVSISDDVYTQRVPPSDRSEGFQWYLSFYVTLLNDVGIANQTILLLDNPGLELHLDGQRDIKRFLEEKVSLDSQVLYVTHSPAMVDPFSLKQVRTVELLPSHSGTKVRHFTFGPGGGADLLEPVRSAIGMSLVSSLVLNEWNILVEGAADKPIIEGIFYRHYSEHHERILVNGSLSESKDAFLVQFYHRTGLPYVVVLDADSGGRQLYGELTSAGIPEERIARLDKVFPDRKDDFAIEDLLSAEFYHLAVTTAYPSNPVDVPSGSGKKRAKLYEEAFKAKHNIGFSKRRAADMVKKLLAEKRDDQSTHANLGTLSTAIIEKLRAQVPQSTEGKEKETGTRESNPTTMPRRSEHS